MKRLPIILGVLTALVFALAVTAAPEDEKKGAPEIKTAPLTWKQAALGNGEDLYVALCASCHGVDAMGNGPASPALAAPAPDLTQLAIHNGGVFPSDQVSEMIAGEKRVVAHGTLEMPVWGRALKDVRPDYKMGARENFARLRIYDLTKYIESIQVKE